MKDLRNKLHPSWQVPDFYCEINGQTIRVEDLQTFQIDYQGPKIEGKMSFLDHQQWTDKSGLEVGGFMEVGYTSFKGFAVEHPWADKFVITSVQPVNRGSVNLIGITFGDIINKQLKTTTKPQVHLDKENTTMLLTMKMILIVK